MKLIRESMRLMPMLCLLFVAGSLSADSGEPSLYLADRTVEYVPGSLPLIIAAPHGGQLAPNDIPDRATGVLTRDAGTDLLAMELAAAVTRRVGARPHLIICHLHRRKVDCNRDALTGAGSHPGALATWRAFHEAIGKARAAAGRGLFVDLHGHSHPVARVEFGYLLGSDQLRETGPGLPALAQVSSLASLARKSPESFDGLLRGPLSLGGLLEKAGFPAVPSPSAPHPGKEPYFRGGYSTARYCSGGEDDGFYALQIECPMPGVRDTPENRRRFAETLAAALEQWLAHHGGIRLGNPDTNAEKGGSK